MPLGMEVELGPGDFVLDGDCAPPPQKGEETPKFSAHVHCGQTAEWIQMVVGMEVGLSPGDFMTLTMGTSPLPKKGVEPSQFSAHAYCGQTAAWIKMPLGTEVGLGPDDIVLDGDPAPPQKGGGAPCPIFGPCLLWPNSCMDQDATCHRGRRWPTPDCVRWGPRSPSPKMAQPPIFGQCLLWPNG